MTDPITTPKRYFIIAGEASGDMHGAELMRAMIALEPDSKYYGIGGPEMVAQGLETIARAEEMAVIGVAEVLKRLPFFFKVMKRAQQAIKAWMPDKIILIDYPDFNMRLAKRLRNSKIPIMYYITPTLWAWREGRIKILRKYVDKLLVIFPFEEGYYSERGVAAEFVGHPIMDEPEPALNREQFMASLGLDPEKPMLTLYPGSRAQELARLLEIFYQAGEMVKQELPDLQIVLGLARGLHIDSVPEYMLTNLTLSHEHPRMAYRYADAAIVASGTATVEGAVWGIPMVVVYRVSSFTWWLGRLLVKTPWIGMVNILAGKEIVPEFLQDRAVPNPIANALLHYFRDGEFRQRTLHSLNEVRHSLLPPKSQTIDGAPQRKVLTSSLKAAKSILDYS